MSARYFGFYEDTAKDSLIIASTAFVSAPKRNDFHHGSNYRLQDNTLEIWSRGDDKYEENLSLTKVSLSDLTTLKTEYDLHRAFYYFPDLANDASTYYEVRWVGAFNATPIKRTDLVNITIQLKEV